MKLNSQQVIAFREIVWEYFRANERSMPWRENPDPYYVLVSELMLQQTQVPRVIPKFEAFIERFPTIASLAQASLADVLGMWSGLGYNRRAKFLYESAKRVVTEHDSRIPPTYGELIKLPGIGPNTAGAIMAYAYNKPVVFIETNIRTVFIHHFFHDQAAVSDEELREIADQVVAHENPRGWYWALMDYGTHLKQTIGGRNNQSKHYKKQSPLAGSMREMRGRIIKVLTTTAMSEKSLQQAVGADERFALALRALALEGMIMRQNAKWCLTGGGDAR